MPNADWQNAPPLRDNDAVKSLRNRQLAIALALFAWVAQLFVPLAHAGAMTRQGLATWCGLNAPDQSQMYAGFAQEIRDLLVAAEQKAKAQAPDCAQICSAAGSVGLPVQVAVGVPRFADRDVRPAAFTSAPPSLRVVSPPVRGPPLNA